MSGFERGKKSHAPPAAGRGPAGERKWKEMKGQEKNRPPRIGGGRRNPLEIRASADAWRRERTAFTPKKRGENRAETHRIRSESCSCCWGEPRSRPKIRDGQ